MRGERRAAACRTKLRAFFLAPCVPSESAAQRSARWRYATALCYSSTKVANQCRGRTS